ncbi:hypothetical protein KCV01_g9983, partial [Aureobasidium melanogenum]
MPTLTLIDGSSYLYRAFHALPPLTNAHGEPTGALFGIVNMLRTTMKAGSDYVAFVCDAPGRTFRDDLYADYKANRPSMPDDLRAQVEPMMKIVGALGFPILCVPGVEADDVIGTLATQASAAGIHTIISTGDKDFAQLVDGHVLLVNTMTNTTMDTEGVVAKFGVRPDQIVDYLTLVGDTVDNVPGVEKCGPKTAAKWLAEYDNLDALLASAERIGGKIGENLRAAIPRLPLSRELVTIRTDVPLDQGPADLTMRDRDVEALRELYARYDFKAALKELDTGTSPAPATAAAANPTPVATTAATEPALFTGEAEYELVFDEAHFARWLEKLETAPLIAFDTETTSIDAMQAEIVGVSLAVEPGNAAYIPLAHDYPGAPKQLSRDHVLGALKPILEDATRPKVGQHGKYDINVLSHYGVQVRGLAHDTMLESYVYNATATRHDMDSLATRYLGYTTIKYEQVAGKGAKQI